MVQYRYDQRFWSKTRGGSNIIDLFLTALKNDTFFLECKTTRWQLCTKFIVALGLMAVTM
jgi:hypothetical protein